MTREINKLVRDKIPEIISKQGGVAKIRELDPAEFKRNLKIKLQEEAKEVADAENLEDIQNELSDIEELVRAIAQDYGISMEQIEQERLKKLDEKGGFKNKTFLESVEE